MLSTIIQSPIGPLTITSDGSAITHLDFGKTKKITETDAILKKCSKELAEYFAGKREHFTVPMKAEGTPFQKKVWKTMSNIKEGSTLTYSDVAKKIGSPNAVRAVGTACGKNPLPILVPCHRIKAKSGLGGFSGGLEKKKWLLQHEA